MVVSSLYFKGEWEHPFASQDTRPSPFYRFGKRQGYYGLVDMMTNRADYAYYNDSTLDCQILGLPYKGQTVTFYFVVPHKSHDTQLHELRERLTGAELRRLVESTRETNVYAMIPKMRLSSTIHLKELLAKLDVQSLFDSHGADLGLLSQGPWPASSEPDENFTKTRRNAQTAVLDNLRHQLDENANDAMNPGLYVEEVLHKVVVDVTEMGTEPGTVTVSPAEYRDGPVVILDEPFLFFIYHEQTKTILFHGFVRVPNSNKK